MSESKLKSSRKVTATPKEVEDAVSTAFKQVSYKLDNDLEKFLGKMAAAIAEAVPQDVKTQAPPGTVDMLSQKWAAASMRKALEKIR